MLLRLCPRNARNLHNLMKWHKPETAKNRGEPRKKTHSLDTETFFGWSWPCRLIWCPVGWLVGGCGPQAVSRKTPIYFIRLVLFSCIYVTGECRWAVDCSWNFKKKRKSKHDHQPGLPEKRLPPKEQLNAFTTLLSSALTPMKVGAVCGCKGSISNPMHLTLSWVC